MTGEPGERWVDMPGFEGLYMISDMGRVYSVPRKDSHGRVRGGHEMRLSNDRDGYKILVLSKDGDRRACKVHSLVLLAFSGERPDGAQVCHRDGNPSNNKLSNLKYGTPNHNNGEDRNAKYGHKYSSPYAGVSILPSGNFRVSIQRNKLRRNLGVFKTELEAYRAYCDAVTEMEAKGL